MAQVNFIMTCIIHNILVLLKITRILKHFLRSITLLFSKFFFFPQHIMMGSPSLVEENIITDVKNLFRLEKLKKRNNR